MAKKAKKAVDVNKPKPTQIVQYIRSAFGQPRGVMAAVANGEYFSVGYSLVNKSAGDRFDRERGTQQALRRAERNLKRQHISIQVPPSIIDSVKYFSGRAKSYFKDKTPVFLDLIPLTPELTPAETKELQGMFTPEFSDSLIRSLKAQDKIPKTLLNIFQVQAKKRNVMQENIQARKERLWKAKEKNDLAK
jgi:hypothetical protein